jgi:hypothetical protein
MSPTHPFLFFTPKNYYYYYFSFFFHFYESLLFHEPDIFYKTSFQIFLSFWEHVKTWVIPMGYPSTCPLHPIPIFPPKNYLLIYFFPFFFIFMNPYSSTNPTFFTKLHFDFFKVFGSMSKLGSFQWVIPLHVPYTPLPIFPSKNYLLIIYSLFFSFL